jgi:hypothetical protein
VQVLFEPEAPLAPARSPLLAWPPTPPRTWIHEPGHDGWVIPIDPFTGAPNGEPYPIELVGVHNAAAAAPAADWSTFL